jgi:hypothetical protein
MIDDIRYTPILIDRTPPYYIIGFIQYNPKPTEFGAVVDDNNEALKFETKEDSYNWIKNNK